jgi:hypothetical protein
VFNRDIRERGIDNVEGRKIEEENKKIREKRERENRDSQIEIENIKDIGETPISQFIQKLRQIS